MLVRLVRAILFAIIPTVLFLFMTYASGEYLLSALFAFYFIILPENWFLIFYAVEPLLYANLFTSLAVFLFFSKYNNLKNSRMFTFLIGFLIFLFSRIAILIKHQSRTNFLLFSIFLFINDRKRLFMKRNLILICALFFISFPVLGFLQSGETTDILTHLEIKDWGDVWQKTTLFFETLPATFYPHAFILVLVLLISIMFHILGILRILRRNIPTNEKNSVIIGQLALFSLIWFLLEAIMLFIGRTLVFEENNIMRYYYAYLLFPQILFLFSYSLYVIKEYSITNKQNILKFVFLISVLLAIFHNGLRLSQTRGGWGDYFLGWRTIGDYVDSQTNNGVIVFQHTNGVPFYFRTNNSIEMSTDIESKEVLLNFSKRFQDVYVGSSAKYPNKPYLELNAKLIVTDNSPYAKFKRLIGKCPKLFYVYKFVEPEKQKVSSSLKLQLY